MKENTTEINTWESWNGNLRHEYGRRFSPSTEEELCSAVAQSTSVRVVGKGYSSADIQAGTESLISLENYNRIVSLDTNKKEVTAQAGVLLKDLIHTCASQDLGFPALPDIDGVTLGGALATGTHGTGRDAHPLSGYMSSCTLVLSDGTLKTFTTKDREFPGLRVSLGLWGIFSTLTFRLEPIEEFFLVEKPMRDRLWLEAFPGWLQDHEFVRVLWLPHTDRGYVILGDKKWTLSLAEFAGADPQAPFQEKPAPKFYSHRRKVSARLYALAVRWPWVTVFVNRILARLFFSAVQIRRGNLYDATVTKSRSGTMELAEWTIALEKFTPCFTELREALHRWSSPAFAHIPMDIRFLKADDTWLGNASGADTVTVGCVTRHAPSAQTYAAFEVIERIFFKHGGRPHWAKYHSLGKKSLAILYPHWEDFLSLRRKMDPQGKFLNPYLKSIFE